LIKAYLDDPTEPRSSEEATRLQNRLMHVSRFATMGEMAAGIAHEINQPLTAVANYAQACARFLAAPAPDLEEVRLAVHEIAAEALRAGEIIRRLRQLVGKQGGEHAPTDVNELIGELGVLVQADARLHRTPVRYELEPGRPRASVDRVQIQHLVLNLVRNALEALDGTPAGSRQVVIRTGLAPAGRVEVSVSDNGPGAAQDMITRMFDPFCTNKSDGTGLGLTISRTIAQAHGGTLDYRASDAGGACFVLTLPPIEGSGP